MYKIPTNKIQVEASDDEIIAVVEEWIIVLSFGDYETVFRNLGFAMSYQSSLPGSDQIRARIENYMSDIFSDKVRINCVSDVKTAVVTTREPIKIVTRYAPNNTNIAGAVDYSLPLNKIWSDLTANFVFTGEVSDGFYTLGLEDIS